VNDLVAIVAATAAAVGTWMILDRHPDGERAGPGPLARLDRRATAMLRQGGLDDVSSTQFASTVLATGTTVAVAASLVLGVGLPALALGLLAAAVPVTTWRGRRRAARAAARDQWPRLIEELRLLTGPLGRPIPQSLLEVGMRGPSELRPAFRAAQREWSLSTDFERTVAVIKERLADPTADATCETLLVIHEVGGDLDRRLQALAEDRRRDLRDRQESEAKQAGARVARLFVVLVPAGMAVAGLNVGDGAAAYRSATAQVVVLVGLAIVAACWWWAGRIMALPDEDRVFDR
jgi:tight adherence protein B